MTPTEAVAFVKRVGEIWPRERMEPGTPDAWYAMGLNEVHPHDAAEALAALARSASFVSLAEILGEVQRVRDQRGSRHPVPMPDAEPDDPATYARRLGEIVRELADRRDLTRAAIPPLGTGRPPIPEYDRARGRYRDPLRIAAKRVRCPWEPCRARIGANCVTATGRPLTTAPAHDARLVEAGLADWVMVEGVRRAVLRDRGVA